VLRRRTTSDPQPGDQSGQHDDQDEPHESRTTSQLLGPLAAHGPHHGASPPGGAASPGARKPSPSTRSASPPTARPERARPEPLAPVRSPGYELSLASQACRARFGSFASMSLSAPWTS